MEEDEFPIGLKILVVDDDETCLFILERMLQSLNYQVTKCRNAEEALCMLREDKGKFDIVISDVHMPTMEEGFKLLETVGLEMKLPVIMMSSDDNHETMTKGIIHGACDYLVKPFQWTALRLIWQHVVRNRRNKEALAVAEPKSCVLVEDDDDDDDDLVASPAKKRRRLVWTAQLHHQFVTAVNQLGHKNCHPKKILDRMQQMGARGLTRENVASHLQKYRIHFRRQNEASQNQRRQSTSTIGSSSRQPNFNFSSSSNELIRLQDYANSGQVPFQSFTTIPQVAGAGSERPEPKFGMLLAGQRNLPLDSRTLGEPRYEMEYQLSNSSPLQANLQSEIPTTMDLKYQLLLHEQEEEEEEAHHQIFGNRGLQVTSECTSTQKNSTSLGASSSRVDGNQSHHLTLKDIAQAMQMVNGTVPAANHDIGQSQTSLNQDVTECNAKTFYPTIHESIPCGEHYNFYINESCFGIPTVEEQHYNKDVGSIVDEHSNWDKLLVDDSQRFNAGSCSYDQPSFEALIYAQNHVAIDDYMPRPFIEISCFLLFAGRNWAAWAISKIIGIPNACLGWELGRDNGTALCG
ncbi:two-component response regulator ARR2 [Prunus yedoensis var. nudiflora]|uniref:Two-component response regulator ARR2 n=1 Tax=Prunus yedoensis var. nudiflora TaxID=2094558 RepID=A0A314ZAP5_PRUYE|nr:two-component response regulator ARR2 [Prunus yedoensis var. nudiflora]